MVILTMMTMMLSGGISNLYMCKGETGKVIEVKASERKSAERQRAKQPSDRPQRQERASEAA